MKLERDVFFFGGGFCARLEGYGHVVDRSRVSVFNLVTRKDSINASLLAARSAHGDFAAYHNRE